MTRSPASDRDFRDSYPCVASSSSTSAATANAYDTEIGGLHRGLRPIILSANTHTVSTSSLRS